MKSLGSSDNDFVIIGVSGVSGIGKTDLAKHLVEMFDSPYQVISYKNPKKDDSYDQKFHRKIQELINVSSEKVEEEEEKEEEEEGEEQESLIKKRKKVKKKRIYLIIKDQSYHDSHTSIEKYEFDQNKLLEEKNFERIKSSTNNNSNHPKSQTVVYADKKWWPSKLQLFPNKKVVVIGFGGASCSGKTTIARIVSRKLFSPIRIIGQDFYFLPKEKIPKHQKYGWNYETPDAVNFSGLKKDLETIRYKMNNLESLITVENNERKRKANISMMSCCQDNNIIYIIIEGFLLFSKKEICGLIDIRIWLEAPQEICRERRERRGNRRRSVREKIPDFGKWFDDEIWKHYLMFKDLQLGNVKDRDFYRFDGTDTIENVVNGVLDVIQKIK